MRDAVLFRSGSQWILEGKYVPQNVEKFKRDYLLLLIFTQPFQHTIFYKAGQKI
jgi:hypothetical protein